MTTETTIADLMSNYLSSDKGESIKDFSIGIGIGNDKKLKWNNPFAKKVSFINCRFNVEVDFSSCKFENGVEFIGCVFTNEFKMVAAKVTGDCHFRACVFEDKANFDRLTVEGKLEVRAPEDKSGLPGSDYVKIDSYRKILLKVIENNYIDTGNYNFKKHPYVVFKKEARFSQIHVTGEANFGSAQFWGWADFYNATICGPTFFRKDFCKGHYDNEKEKNYFAPEIFPPVTFKAGVRFRSASFGGELNFHAADFSIFPNQVDRAWENWNKAIKNKRKDKPTVDFSYVTCKGIVFFCDPDLEPQVPLSKEDVCKFDFGNKTIEVNDKKEIKFAKAKIDFEGAQFDNSVRFVNTQFPNATNGNTDAERMFNFRDCKIEGDLEFWHSVPSLINLSGCSYKRIVCKPMSVVPSTGETQPENKNKYILMLTKAWDVCVQEFKNFICIEVNVKELDNLSTAIINSEKSPPNENQFDRRSWVQLESSFRAEGRVKEADDIYIVRKRRQRELEFEGKWFYKFIDVLFDFFVGYGVNNKKILIWSFISIFLSSVIYLSTEFVKEDEKPDSEIYELSYKIEYPLYSSIDPLDFLAIRLPPASNMPKSLYVELRKQPDKNDPSEPITCWETIQKAISISAQNFFPFELPYLEKYKPKESWGVIVANIEKLLGWIFIPLLIANIGGFLNNKAKPQGGGD